MPPQSVEALVLSSELKLRCVWKGDASSLLCHLTTLYCSSPNVIVKQNRVTISTTVLIHDIAGQRIALIQLHLWMIASGPGPL
jgi:hypothetical protein